VKILQRFQSKILRIITDAAWYVSNLILHKDLGIKTVKEEIEHYSIRFDQHANVSCRIYERESNAKIEEENPSRHNYII